MPISLVDPPTATPASVIAPKVASARLMSRVAAVAVTLVLAAVATWTLVQYPGSDAASAGGPPASSSVGSAVPTTAPTPTPAIAGGAPGSQVSSTKVQWRPEAGLSWQWQLSVPVDQSVNVAVYDIDLFENSGDVVKALHAAGRKVICYLDVGSYEDYRPDKGLFPASVRGKSNGWAGENWLDIRQLDVLRPIMAARMDLCAQRGFDGVEPDLMDGYTSDTGFPLTASDQLKYNLMIADLGHERGLAVGLKNDLAQIPQLVSDFDFSVNEQCAEYSECEMLLPFIAAGKPVFHAEYSLPKSSYCAMTSRLGLSSIRKRLELGSWRDPC
ncbi:MAG: putative endo alpha,4 polygalactosaminidase [Pseudonocardiales bacterium]|nr:putative endo alpha,4 polygalactosaminidase [Pseudonocardiales bacterium]